MIYAHDWEILNGERIARWPSEDDPRPLRVKLYSWVGFSIGAQHFYCTVEEAKNQWWSEERNDWIELSCDSGNKGYSLRADCMTRAEAEELADLFVNLIKVHNPKQPYRVSWDNDEDEECT